MKDDCLHRVQLSTFSRVSMGVIDPKWGEFGVGNRHRESSKEDEDTFVIKKSRKRKNFIFSHCIIFVKLIIQKKQVIMNSEGTIIGNLLIITQYMLETIKV